MPKLHPPSLTHSCFFTGENGTIDGQGDAWWNKWRQGSLQFTRPNLVEFVNSRDIIISNVVFKNSPFWNIHPVYSRYRLIEVITHENLRIGQIAFFMSLL